jgi:hypothetical protein
VAEKHLQRPAWRFGIHSMSIHTLTSPREAESLIARMFKHDHTCIVRVREDKAFQGTDWLSLGTIAMENGVETTAQLMGAVRRGAFEWNVPKIDPTRQTLAKLLGLKDDQKSEPKLHRALDAMAAISVRTGLQHPRFDPQALEGMPFRRSTTVVADTSGAVQGGLDFVARYLHPAARVKVPAIVQMEIVNFAERFLSGRRATKTRCADLLIDHLLSQGGQRVLLRLELQADTEVERTFLLGDPLRSAFQSDKDPELSELNFSVSIRAYADRLILEAARHHQAQANLGHKVQLLTSDQGLARMALAEGIVPLFFTSVEAKDFFGHRLTGTTLDPFSGRLRDTSIASLLWELATAFGSARLDTSDSAHNLVVSAFGDGLSWSPYQSHADLLWCNQDAVPPWPAQLSSSPNGLSLRMAEKGISKKSAATKKVTHLAKLSAHAAEVEPTQVSLLRFNVSQLFGLIDALDNSQSMSEESIVEVVGARNREGIEEYRRFLISGGFITLEDRMWTVGPKIQSLAVALRNESIDELRRLLLSVPSYDLFSQRITATGVGNVWEPGEFKRSATTYRMLGEVTQICAPIAGEGLYPTPSVPDLAAFALIAIQRFRDLDQGDGLVATGIWLEDLIRKDGIHPEIARLLLNDASATNLLSRSTEGSTTDIRFDNHVIQVLRVQAGKPVVTTVHLYRGDYLIPGKSSTSLRIQGVQS